MSKYSRKKARREYKHQDRFQEGSWRLTAQALGLHCFYGGWYHLNKVPANSKAQDLFASYTYDYEYPSLIYFKKK